MCIGENKDADQLRSNREADQRLSFRSSDSSLVQLLFYLNSKFQASSSFLCLYRPVCVGPVRKPHCWFSHEMAQICEVHFSEKLYALFFRFHMSLDMRKPDFCCAVADQRVL